MANRSVRSVRPSCVTWLSMTAFTALLLTACLPAVSLPTPGPSATAPGLSAASSGLCQAIAALPSASLAERAFTNMAHEALHVLAADSRIDRTLRARVLEAMEKVEADFSAPADTSVLADDLAALQGSAHEALRSVDVQVPACAP